MAPFYDPWHDALMAEIVNLRQERRKRERAEAQAVAAENRIRHGRTKAERKSDRLAAEKAERKLDGARREEP
jgi:Domain of unknown function (DUF4169)